MHGDGRVDDKAGYLKQCGQCEGGLERRQTERKQEMRYLQGRLLTDYSFCFPSCQGMQTGIILEQLIFTDRKKKNH